MKESAHAAWTYARSHAESLRRSPRRLRAIDVHIHVPAGAIPKDGPSAGVTMATALVSALSRRPVRHDVAMTGEITLSGRVLPIGGVKEKVLGAVRAGIREIVLPKENEQDLEDLPQEVRDRVHPEYLDGQKLPPGCLDRDTVWEQRFESIRDFERHLARNGTVVLKFWLNVSKEEQRRRFLSRLDEPEKNWKYSEGDVAERRHWDAYQHAYAEMLPATSRAWAPWYAIPADDKPFMRVAVAEIVADTLESLGLSYPRVTSEQRRRFERMRSSLE
jgi:hypothetical protein